MVNIDNLERFVIDYVNKKWGEPKHNIEIKNIDRYDALEKVVVDACDQGHDYNLEVIKAGLFGNKFKVKEYRISECYHKKPSTNLTTRDADDYEDIAINEIKKKWPDEDTFNIATYECFDQIGACHIEIRGHYHYYTIQINEKGKVTFRTRKEYSNIDEILRWEKSSPSTKTIKPLGTADFLAMTGVEFEDYIGNILNENNFIIKKTKRTNDGGVDLLAKTTDPLGNEIKYIIQCKNWTQPVGAAAVRDLAGTKKIESADKAILVSASGFTRGAFTTAEKAQIDLWPLISTK